MSIATTIVLSFLSGFLLACGLWMLYISANTAGYRAGYKQAQKEMTNTVHIDSYPLGYPVRRFKR